MLLQGLAKSIAWDGEGATCLMEVEVTGAKSDADARTAAKSVAGSSLVKSAIFGHDPNWGRIAAAAGYSGEGTVLGWAGWLQRGFVSLGLLCDLLCGQVLLCAVASQVARKRPAATLKAQSTGDPLHEAATALQCVPVFPHLECPPCALSDCVVLCLQMTD